MNGISDADDNRTQLEIYELADALVRGDITAAESDRLGRLIESDPDARAHYLRFMHDSARLCRWSSVWRNSKGSGEGRAQSAKCRVESEEDGGERGERSGEQYEGEPAADAPFRVPASAILQPASAFLPTPATLPSPLSPLPSTPLSPLHYLFGSVLFSYLAVAAIFAGGLLAAWAWRPGGGDIAIALCPCVPAGENRPALRRREGC